MTSLKKVSAGFATDMNALKEKFASANSVCFKDFSRLWREMQFSLIFCGRKDVRESRLFVEEIVPIILRLWHPTCTYEEKVFALYMLYAVYATQPLVPKTKIRLRLSEWNQSEEILLRASEDQQLDVCYAIYRMRLEKCFHFVASLKRRSPIMLAYESEEDADELVLLQYRVFSGMEKICAEGGIFQTLSLRHQHYMALKTGHENPYVKSLGMVTDNIFEDLIRKFTGLQAQYKAVQETAAGTSHDESEEESVSSEDEDNLASRRRALRAKLYRNRTASHKERRFEQLLAEPGCSGSAEAHAPPAEKEAGGKSKPRAPASGTRKASKNKNSDSAEASVAPKRASRESKPRTSASGTGKSRKKQDTGSADDSVAPAAKRASRKSKPRTSGAGKSQKKQDTGSAVASVPRAAKSASGKNKPGASGSGAGKCGENQDE